MLAIQTSLSIYDLQRTGDIVPTPGSFILFVYLFGNREMLTILFQYPTFYSASCYKTSVWTDFRVRVSGQK